MGWKQNRRGIRRVLAFAIAVVMAASVPLFALADTTEDRNPWSSSQITGAPSIGASGITQGSVRVAGTNRDDNIWEIDETDMNDVVLAGKVPVVVGDFPVQLRLQYDFYNYNSPTITITNGDGEAMPSPYHYSDANPYDGYLIAFDSWDDEFSMRVESDGKTPVTYKIGIKEGEGQDDYYLLQSLSIVLGDNRYTVNGSGAPTGGISLFSLLPLLEAGDLDIELEDEELVSHLLDATVEYAFPADMPEAGLATQDGRPLESGGKLFENLDEVRNAMGYGGFSLVAGPLEQLNVNRTRYTLNISGGIDDISQVEFFARNNNISPSTYGYGYVYEDEFYFSFDKADYDPAIEYTLEVYPSYLQGAKPGFLSLYEGKDKTGGDKAAEIQAGTYATKVVADEWFTVTAWHMGEKVDYVIPVVVNLYDGGGGSGNSDRINLSLNNYYGELQRSDTYNNGNDQYIIWKDDVALDSIIPDLSIYLYYTDSSKNHWWDPNDPTDEKVTITLNGAPYTLGTPADFSKKVSIRATWGTAYDESVYISTNVVDGAAKLYVTAEDGQTARLYDYGSDRSNRNNEFFFYNLGTARLNDLKVTLKSGAAVEIDPYWTVGNETVFTPNYLQGIDLSEYSYYGTGTNSNYKWNRGKIRILPKAGTKEGKYEDELIFTVGGELVRSISFTADIREDITARYPVTGVSLNTDSATISVGATTQLVATVKPAHATNPGVVWSSSNQAVATVNESGLVTGIAAGSATITATTVDGGFTASCVVTVTSSGSGGNNGGGNNGGNGSGNNNGGGSIIGGNIGGGSGSGSSGGSGGTTKVDGNIRTSSTQTTASGVHWVDNAEAKSLANRATTEGLGYVRIQRTGSTGLRKEALAALKGLSLQVDSIVGRSVQVRIILPDPAKETADTLLSGWVTGNRVTSTSAIFSKWYTNTTAVVSLEQQGSFGQVVEVAAKVDVSKLDTSNLVFYSYDRASNSFTRITNTAYYIDSNGYLHFHTQRAGDIIITDKALVRK